VEEVAKQLFERIAENNLSVTFSTRYYAAYKKTATAAGMSLTKDFGPVHIMPEKFENGVLFLSPVSPSVHTNPSRERSFWKTFVKPDQFKNASFWCRQKTFFLKL